jgi:hypothetical protein
MTAYIFNNFNERRNSMNRFSAVAVIIAGIFCFDAPQAQMAVRWKGSAGWGIGTAYEHQFTNYNLQVVSGTIYRIDTVTPLSGMSYGIQLVIRTTASREEVPVHLGPAWYVLCQDMNLGLNDPVEVRGARFSLKGKSTIAAFEVRPTGSQNSDKVLLLRDQDGVPYWSGWRKRKL